jgi:transketolase
MRGIPGVNVFSPSDEEDMLIGLPEVFASRNPYYIRYTNLKAPVAHQKIFKTGKAEIISEGNDTVILVHGMLLNQSLEAAGILKQSGKSVGIINLRSLKPLDEDLIIKICMDSNLVVTLEDHFITGGLFSILSEILVKNRISCRVFPIALENKWFKPALLNDVLRFEKFDGRSIAERIGTELKKIHYSRTGYSV